MNASSESFTDIDGHPGGSLLQVDLMDHRQIDVLQKQELCPFIYPQGLAN